MDVSPCCGAPMKLVTRPDHPFVYDDIYDLQLPCLLCTKCGKEIVTSLHYPPNLIGSTDQENLM